MIAAAQAQAAKEAWASQPEMRLYCFNRGLAKYNANIAGVVQAGVTPNDPRLAPVATECARFEASALKTKYRCTVTDENGWAVQSTCNQVFARQDPSGQLVQIDVRTAIDLYFDSGSYLLGDLETDAGRQERYAQAQRQRVLADLSSLRTEIEGLLTSRSEPVRAQAQKLVKRIQAANNPKSSVSSADADAIRREHKALVRFEETENARIAALDTLDEVRARAEQRATGELAPEIRSDFETLQAQYVEAVRQPAPAPATEKEDASIGPTFDCQKVKDPLGRIICSDQGLRRLDVDLLRPYYVLRFSSAERRDQFKQEAVAFTQSVLQTCRVPEKGNIASAAMKKAVPCIMAEYRRQRDLWQTQMEQLAPSSAREETGRSLEEHVRLQKMLQDVGLIPSAEKADGVYGVGTRTAINTFQSSEGLTADGILSDVTAERLARRASQSVAGGSRVEGGAGRIAELTSRYTDLIERIGRYEARRARERQLVAMIPEAESFARDSSALPLSDSIKAALASLLDNVAQARASQSMESLERLDATYKAVKASTQDAVRVLNATTDKNRFVVEGEPDDVLVLYNETGRAPSLVRNLKGDFVFQGDASRVCQPHEGSIAKNVSALVNVRLETYGKKFDFPLSRCDTSDLGAYDLIVASRKLFRSGSASEIVPVLKVVDSAEFRTMFSITAGDVNAVVQAEADRLRELEASIQAGTAHGFGLIALSNAQGDVCETLTADAELHKAALQPMMERIVEELKGSPSFKVLSVEDAFIAAKRGQCVALYSEAGDLKSLAGALQRDQVAFRYLPVWIDDEKLAQAREGLRIAAERAVAEAKAKAEAEARRVAEAKAKAEAQATSSQAADRGNSQRAVERLLRTYAERYSQAKSEDQWKPLRGERKWALGQMFSDARISKLKNWVGKIHAVTVDQYGNINRLEIDIAGGRIEGVSAIRVGTKLHQSLIEASAKPGDFVLFSADVDSTSEKDFFPEGSVTDNGSMTDPEYKVSFTSADVIMETEYKAVLNASDSDAEQVVQSVAQNSTRAVEILASLQSIDASQPIDKLDGNALLVGRRMNQTVKGVGKVVAGAAVNATLGFGGDAASKVLDSADQGGGPSSVSGELVLFHDRINFVESSFSQFWYEPSGQDISLKCKDLTLVRAFPGAGGERTLELMGSAGALRFTSNRADFFVPRIKAICDLAGERLKR